MPRFRFSPAYTENPPLTPGDGLILLGLVGLLYLGVRLALTTPIIIAGPEISLAPRALPWYTLLSIGRMTAAYCISLLFSLTYGYAASRNHTARALLMPLLDILQSVPILSFLPVVLLGLNAVLSQNLAAELAAVILIFTSQAWNMTFSFYQSMTTLPTELREAAAIFRLSPWQRFKTLELPFAAIGLLWNSIMSWAGGWFFLMAAETFQVGDRDFRLPGLGSYLQTAANRGNLSATLLGLGTLVTVIILLDQCLWRPLIAWANKFKMETTESETLPTSWFLDLWQRARLVKYITEQGRQLSARRRSNRPQRRRVTYIGPTESVGKARVSGWIIGLGVGLALALAYTAYLAAVILRAIPQTVWAQIGLGLFYTFLRVAAALGLALAWTIPVGVVIGVNPRWARLLQPIVQVLASIPATALFPVLLLALLRVPSGLNIAAVGLMLIGTQWYLLFNIIAGASAIPQDLKYTTDLLRLSRFDRWRRLILPALFPYIITGAITASGGAWNASIVAEFVKFGGRMYATRGLGALISQATATGDNALLLAATLTMVLTVVFVNRVLWRRLYRLAEERYRLD